MNSQPPKGDHYFASIKRFIFPFILLNIVAVILGASAVNIANLLNFLSPDPKTDYIDEIDREANLDSSPESITTDLETKLDEYSLASNIYLPSISSDLIAEPALLQSSAYPEPINNPLLTKSEDETEYDIASSQTKEIETNISTTKADIENSHEKELNEQLEEKQIRDERRQLILPTVDVTAPIVDVPILNGNWDISRLDDDAGVLEGFAKHPEDSGALVVAAHATTEWPIAGPFADLRLMNLGDPIIYQIGDTEYIYEISRFLRVDTSDVNILKKGGEDGIVLVTCGSYNFFTGEYGSRLIAYGNLIETRPAAQNPDL